MMVQQRAPDAVVALEQPVPASPEPKSTVEFRRSLGKRLPPVEEACEQLDVSAVSAKLQAGVGCSPAMETVQPQSPSLVVPVVGQLARAAAYIRECVNRRIPLREEFVRRAPKGPPDRTEAIRQPGLKVVNEEGGVNGSFRSPEGLAALALPIDYSPALPLQAIIPCPLLDGLAPLVGIARRQRGLVVVKTDCSAGIECTPTLEAAQRQFIPFLVLSRGREGGQLASAAKYIRERINERSPVCEEFGCRAPREPPDKVAEVETEPRRQARAKSKRVVELPRPQLEAVQEPEPGKANVLSHSCPGAAPQRPEANCGLPSRERWGADQELRVETTSLLGRPDGHFPSVRKPSEWIPSCPDPPSAETLQHSCASATSSGEASLGLSSPCAAARSLQQSEATARPSAPTVAASFEGIPEVDGELVRRAPELLGQPVAAGQHALSSLRLLCRPSLCLQSLRRLALLTGGGEARTIAFSPRYTI